MQTAVSKEPHQPAPVSAGSLSLRVQVSSAPKILTPVDLLQQGPEQKVCGHSMFAPSKCGRPGT